MSIDHGKLLALADRLTPIARDLDPDDIYMATPSMGGKAKAGAIFAVADELRALAQPAEAVEVFNCLDCPVSVESPWVAPRCPECGGPTELDSSAKPISDEAKRMLALESNQVFRAQYDDAAQGAVADVALTARRLLADQFPHQVTKDLLVIDGLADGVVDTRLALAAIENALRTHSQAAPAQGDGWEWVAGYMQGANDYVGGAQGALDQDELRADAEMARRHYAAELAAAPSQEGE